MFKEFIINKLPFLFVIHNLYFKSKIFISRDSYADSKEDLFILKNIKKRGFYIDVGCHHPTRLNNCHLLYKKGWRGINIDINKSTIDLFNFARPEDININAAVSLKEQEVNFFYDKPLSLYNSLKKQKNLKFKKTIKSYKLDSLIKKTKYKDQPIDFLSVDVEGKDLEVLKSLNFNTYKPRYICVEIWGKEKNKSFKLRNDKIFKFLKEKNYSVVFNKKENYIFKRI